MTLLFLGRIDEFQKLEPAHSPNVIRLLLTGGLQFVDDFLLFDSSVLEPDSDLPF